MPDNVLTCHETDATPLHRNVVPIAECKVRSVATERGARPVVDVPILGCDSVWLRCQKEAEAWIAPGGKLIADPVKRNRRINAAYAQLWESDHRFQWAGLAAFASKQVGCGLLHATANIERAQQEIHNDARYGGYRDNTELAAATALPSAIQFGSAYTYGQLALGNLVLFLDIYPLHRFYALRGLKHMADCIGKRKSIASRVIWPLDSKKLVFGFPFREIALAFEFIEQGKISDSVRQLAWHEQVNILQSTIYNDVLMRRALDGNQFAWATGFPSGVAAEIQLTLSSECSVKSSKFSVWFSRDIKAELYTVEQRMQFVNRAAARFDTLLHNENRSAVEQSIRKIAAMEVL